MLRVAWSPDGGVLASGGADGVVKLWRCGGAGSGGGDDGDSSSSGARLQRTYGARELAALGGHPEEVYALQFVSRHGGADGGTADSAAGSGDHAGSSGSQADWLVAGSGQSLFLWDVRAGALAHEAAPPGARAVAAPRGGRGGGGGGGSAQAQQRQGQGGGSGSSGEEEEEDDNEEEEEEGFPPYVFSLAAQPPGAASDGLLATACCDGGLRLWRLGAGRLELVGEARAHASDMGSVCAFSPARPWLLVSVSKGGEVAAIDVRKLQGGTGASGSGGGGSGGKAACVLARRRAAGPVFGAAWLPAGTFACRGGGSDDGDGNGSSGGGSGGSGGSSGGGSGGGEQLALVGADSVVRLYDAAEATAAFSVADLSSGGGALLSDPLELPMPGGYGGRLLAVAIDASGRRLAAGGEPVAAARLAPLARPRPRAAAAAAATAATAAAGRRRRGAAGQRIAFDALASAGGDGGDGESGGLFEQLSLSGGGGEERTAAGHGCREAASKERAPLYVFECV